MRSPISAAGSSQRRPAVHVCLGTRPEIIKMAPVIEALKRRGLETRIIHTGQHPAHAWPLYRYFGLEPAIELSRPPEERSLSALSAGLIRSLEHTLGSDPPRALLVHGDTTNAAMAAMVAFYQKIPVAHVEAGLRSHRIDDPFPEEFNRRLIARVARWHFAPSETAVRNLYQEGVEPAHTFLVGNTIVDATITAVGRLDGRGCVDDSQRANDGSLDDTLHGVTSAPERNNRLVLVCLHQREHRGEPVAALARAIFALVQAHPELNVVWPLHADPQIAEQVREQARHCCPELNERCLLVAPLDHPDLTELLAQAWLVITDSGELQEQACALQVPVLVARTGTECPELIELGAGRLVGTEPLNLIREFERLWRDPARHASMRNVRHPYGDGRAAERIATVLAQALEAGQAEGTTPEAETPAPTAMAGPGRLYHPTSQPRSKPRPTTARLDLSEDWPNALGARVAAPNLRSGPGKAWRVAMAGASGDPR